MISVEKGLEIAEDLCKRRGLRLTKHRREVFSCLLASDHPLKAYDIIDLLRTKGENLSPATMYRTLDFLQESGLIHKVSCINAFMPCTCEHTDQSSMLFVCSSCQNVKEIDDKPLYEMMRARFLELGISAENTAIEMQGLCLKCQQKMRQ
ncbi:MAG: transcriptional repressor [Desulfovibrionaceae bacterium]|nr:transcriptional repressor [Desulfovibrionaceae bacterium]